MPNKQIWNSTQFKIHSISEMTCFLLFLFHLRPIKPGNTNNNWYVEEEEEFLWKCIYLAVTKQDHFRTLSFYFKGETPQGFNWLFFILIWMYTQQSSHSNLFQSSFFQIFLGHLLLGATHWEMWRVFHVSQRWPRLYLKQSIGGRPPFLFPLFIS